MLSSFASRVQCVARFGVPKVAVGCVGRAFSSDAANIVKKPFRYSRRAVLPSRRSDPLSLEKEEDGEGELNPAPVKLTVHYSSDFRWYLVAVSGKDEFLEKTLPQLMAKYGYGSYMRECVCPTRTQFALKGTRLVEKQIPSLPGFLLCRLALPDHVLAFFLRIPYVTSIATELTDQQVADIRANVPVVIPAIASDGSTRL
jgi:hypothetical protein